MSDPIAALAAEIKAAIDRLDQFISNHPNCTPMPKDSDGGMDDPTVDQNAGLDPSQTAQNAPESTQTPNSIDTTLPWTSQDNNWHNVRVLCDLAGLEVAKTIVVEFADGHKELHNGKDIITACVQQESDFDNNAICTNHDSHGNVTSRDYGIVQINSTYHIGPGKDFPSPEYVVGNPDKAVQFMIDMFKADKLSMWVSYSSGAYKKFLPQAAIKPSLRSNH